MGVFQLLYYNKQIFGGGWGWLAKRATPPKIASRACGYTQLISDKKHKMCNFEFYPTARVVFNCFRSAKIE